MTQTEAMKQALEALENSVDLVSQEARNAEELYGKYPTRLARIQGLVAFEVAHEKAITSLKAALAEQPAQQEPVAYWIPKAKQFCLPSSDGTRPFAKAWEPLYTSPPAQRTWVGLTNKDIYECEPKTDWYDSVEFVQAIEAKLKEKNT